MFRRLGHIQSCACVAMWYVRQTVVRWKRGKMETKLLESGTEAFEWWSFRLSVKWACKAEKGRGKWNRWLRNYERPLWFPLNFISPFFSSYPPVKSTHSLTPCPFISLLWLSLSDPLSVWLFVNPLCRLTGWLHPFHLLSSPQAHETSSPFLSFPLLFYVLRPFFTLFSLLPLLLRPLNSSWERRCLTADSLTQIRVDILQRCFLQLTFFVSISDNDCNLHSIRWIPNQISIATLLCSISCIQNDCGIAWFWPIVVSKRYWLHVL